jgi:hypothetical protein
VVCPNEPPANDASSQAKEASATRKERAGSGSFRRELSDGSAR